MSLEILLQHDYTMEGKAVSDNDWNRPEEPGDGMFWLCGETFDWWFDVPEEVERIWFCVSPTKTRGAYHLIRRREGTTVDVHLDSGEVEAVTFYWGVFNQIVSVGDSVWVWVEYEAL